MASPQPDSTVAPSTFNPEDLLAAQAFPHPVSNLTLRETHISWVILTGDFAYKIKKPVRFDFIDCSTLEQRRRLCEEELRLNRRLAPQLYVQVVPITRRDGGLQIGGSGPVIEYAVCMRQFDAAAELSTLLTAGGVEGDEIVSLAELLARFHLQAPVQTGLASAHQALDAALGNLAQLQPLLQQTVDGRHLRSLSGWCHEQARALEALLQLRARDGFIRECHGDLHAGNIARFAGRLVPFDCLEFSAALRWIDTIDDLAFLVMDLRSRGRHDLALVLLSRYLEVTGDYAGLNVLRFYCVYRALVRAKVDALSIQQQAGPTEQLRVRLSHRLDAAIEWTQPQQPCLVLMHGASGSGKSWVSERLVAALPAVRVRSDVERKRLAGVDERIPAAAPLQHGIYTAQFSHRTYARLADCAERCLGAGLNVIIDAASLQETDREVFRKLASAHHAGFSIVSCQADPIELANRILRRGREHNDPSDASLAVLDAQLRGMQPFTAEERGCVVTLDTQQWIDIERLARIVTAQGMRG